MRPISAGSGEERYTLYFPVYFKNKDALRFRDVLDAIRDKLGVAVDATEKGTDLSVIRAASFGSMEDAQAAFEWLRAVFNLASVENDLPIRTYDSIDEFKPCEWRFPGSWPSAAEVGWNSDPDGIQVDGIVNIILPTIVPEHLRIVDQDAGLGTVMDRTEADAVLKAVYSASAVGGDIRKLNLACASYVSALFHQNYQLRYLGFTTCLEVLADRRDKEDAFKTAIEYFCIAGEERSEAEGNAAVKQYALRIRNLLENGKKQSLADSIGDLLSGNLSLINEGLPLDHPYRQYEAKKIAASIYRLRSKIAHEGTWGEFHNDEIHRAYQFVKTAAKTLLRHALSGKNATPTDRA